MVDGFEIVDKIREYLNDKIDLGSFREWMACAQIDAASKSEKSAEECDAARLLISVEARYAEFSDGILDEAAWRRRLAYLVSPAPQSAESSLLTYYYSASSFPPDALMDASQVKNINTLPNYKDDKLVYA